jgi:uncharacterized repeat protein (TIGR01451 family)
VSVSGGGATAGPDTLDFDILEPNLSATITSDKSTVTLGDTVTFTVEIEPTIGRTNAFETNLELIIPDGLSYIDGSFMGQGTLDDSDFSALSVERV